MNYTKEHVKNIILLSEEYGRIATLKEQEIGVENYTYIAELFTNIGIALSKHCNWDEIQEKYMEFIDQFWKNTQ